MASSFVQAIKPQTVTKPNTAETKAGDVFLALFIEIGGLALAVMIAGINEDASNIVLIVMIAIFVLWLVMHPTEVQALSNIVTNANKAAGQ